MATHSMTTRSIHLITHGVNYSKLWLHTPRQQETTGVTLVVN